MTVRKALHFAGVVGVGILNALLGIGVMLAVYNGGWLALVWVALLWIVVIIESGKHERQFELRRRAGYRTGYSQGWRDCAANKEYQPWPVERSD